jgi:hypothetical protein
MKSSIFSKFHTRGAGEQISSKTPLLNNFLTVRRVFTKNILIDSGLQGERVQISKKFQISR